MSSPDTKIEKQKKRHVGPLIGMVVVAIIALVFLATFMLRPTEEEAEAVEETSSLAPFSSVKTQA